MILLVSKDLTALIFKRKKAIRSMNQFELNCENKSVLDGSTNATTDDWKVLIDGNGNFRWVYSNGKQR